MTEEDTRTVKVWIVDQVPYPSFIIAAVAAKAFVRCEHKSVTVYSTTIDLATCREVKKFGPQSKQASAR